MSVVTTITAGGQERMLVVTKPYVGDTVLAIPFLRNLRQSFPHARIEVCAEPTSAAVLAACPYVDEIVTWERSAPRGPARRRGLFALDSLAGTEALAATLRQRRYTRAYLLKSSLSALLLACRSRIPRRIGYARELGRLLLTRAVTRRKGRHQVETYLDLLRAEGLAVDEGRNENWQPPELSARADSFVHGLPAGRPRVFLAVRATIQRRRWPWCLLAGDPPDTRHWQPAKWSALVEWLVRERRCEVVFCGGPGDATAHAEVRAGLTPETTAHLHDCSAEVSLREVGPLLARMHLCVGIDTGLVHMAASFGTPVVKLAGGTDQRQWGPWMTRHAVLAAPNATDIPLEAVRDRVAAFLPPPLAAIDLRHGRRTYAVVEHTPATAAVPATNPLAHAH
jgi:heptosyltransferase-2